MSNLSQSDAPFLQSPPEEWVDAYGDNLYRYALARVQEPDAAEDLVQETFLAALKGKDSFEGRSSVLSWMISILKHKLIDFLRKRNKEQAVEHIHFQDDPASELFNEKGRWKSGPEKWKYNPDHLMEQREFLNLFFNCLQSLNKRLSQVFSLKELDGLNSKEICKILDITTSNLWVLMYRARIKLRICLEKNGTGINK